MTCYVLNGENIGEIYYENDKDGRVIRKFYKDANGNDVLISSYTYDYAGNVLSETNFDGNTKTTTYDNIGRVLTDSDFKGKYVEYTYDSLGRVTRQVTPLNDDIKSITEYEYDGRGNVVKQRVSNNPDDSSVVTYRLTENAYDSMGNLTDCTVYDGKEIILSVHYEYDTAGRITKMYEGLTAVYDENMSEDMYNLTTYTYDCWGNPYTVTYADGSVDTTIYNAYGQLIHSYMRDETRHHKYLYDIFGRMTDDIFHGASSYAYQESYRYIYDRNDNITAISEYMVNDVYEFIYDDEGNPTDAVFYDWKRADLYEYTYDGLGRLTKEKSWIDTDDISEKTFTYDEFGNQLTAKITLNEEEIYNKASTYDEFLLLENVSQGGKTTSYTYDDNGNLETEATADIVTTYGYNDANMVLTMATTKGNANVTTFVYNYYTDGNQRTKVDTINNVTTSYTYDGAGQLKSEVKTGSVNQTDLYWYDASGNRTLKNEYRPDAEGDLTSKFIRSTYNEMNQLVESTDSKGNSTTTYTYDAYGNLTSDGKFEYEYDEYYNRLKYVYNIETDKLTQYDYYVDGLRKSKDNTYFIWLDGNMVYEFTSDDSNTYTYGHRLLYSDDAKYVLNAHGDVVALLNSDGETVKEYDYDAFGNELNIDTTDTNPFRYCAEYFDTETDTIYLRARYYSPTTGRFTQQDPIKDGLNWYAYCYNNPIAFIDPSGLDPEDEVMLRFIIEKNGGCVDYHQGYEDPDNYYVTASLNGITKTYKVGEDIHIVEGRSIIQKGKLMLDFQIQYECDASHESMDIFPREIDAVLAFSYTYLNTSKNERQEYSASINYADGNYYFSGVYNSAKTANIPLKDLTSHERKVVSVLHVENSIANIHIHWKNASNFSHKDRKSETATQPMYLVNKAGDIYYTSKANGDRYYPHGDKVTSLYQ